MNDKPTTEPVQATYEQLASAFTVLNAHSNDLDAEIGTLKRERKELKMVNEQLFESNKNLTAKLAALESQALGVQEKQTKLTAVKNTESKS